MTYPEGRKERSFRPFSSLGICARKAACGNARREGPLGAQTRNLRKGPGESGERGREPERGAGRHVCAGVDGPVSTCPAFRVLRCGERGRKRAGGSGEHSGVISRSLPGSRQELCAAGVQRGVLETEAFPGEVGAHPVFCAHVPRARRSAAQLSRQGGRVRP